MNDISAHSETSLVLEIFKQGDALLMGLYSQQERSSAVRHYTESPVDFVQVNRLCGDIFALLEKAGGDGSLSAEYFGEITKAARVLWDHLVPRPIKARLRSCRAGEIILFIDEELAAIPWELLYDGTRFLCLAYSLGRVIRAKSSSAVHLPVVYRGGARSIPLKMLILANPTGDLPSAYLEGMEIKNRFERRRRPVRIDFKSTAVDSLYVKKNLREYDILHFAGHCEYDDSDRQNTGWLLRDGRLTAQDIIAMGSSGGLPSLVFSNACLSARAPADVIAGGCRQKDYSLAAAFLFSGVRHYVGTVRRIEDPVSAVFARAFYEELSAGSSVGESVRRSRLKVIQERGIEAILWAGYVLYGNPDSVLVEPSGVPAAQRPGFSRRTKRALYVSSTGCACALAAWMAFSSPTLRPDAYVLFARSRRLFDQGRTEHVLEAARRVLKKDPLFLAVYPLMADTYLRLGDKDNAIKYYYDYCLFSERKRDYKHLAAAYSGLGWSYHIAGNYSRANEFYTKAAALSLRTGDKLNEAVALRRLAVWYIDKKDFNKALELLTKSSYINSGRQYIFEHRYNLACDYFDIGLLFANKDDYAGAREFYAKSRVLFEKMKCTRELSDCYFNLGELYMFEKEYQKALDYYMKGLNVDREQNNRMNLPGDYGMIAELYVEMDDHGRAEQFFLKSAGLAEDIRALPEQASAYYQLGLMYKKTGDIPKARDSLRRAQELYRTMDPEKYEEAGKELSGLGS